MSALQNALDAPASAPVPAAPPAAAPIETNTGDANITVNDYVEVSGKIPPAPPKPVEPAGKYNDLAAANKGYDELYKMYTNAAGRTANTVDKLEQTLNNLPTLLAQALSAQQQAKAVEPQKPIETRPADNTPAKFDYDVLSDPDRFNQVFEARLQALTPKAPALDEAKLLDGLSGRLDQLVESRLAAREEAMLRARADAEVKELVGQGNDQALVEAAVLYGIKNGKSTVSDSWKFFQQKFPQVFAAQKAESIIGEVAGQRQQLPRELGNGVSVDQADGLRSAFAAVRNHKFASQELL